MRVPILVERTEGGGYRARTGEPMAITVEAATDREALGIMTARLQEVFSAGAKIAFVEVPNGASNQAPPLSYVPTPTDDWFFDELEQEIANNRRLEAEDEAKRWMAKDSVA